MKSYKHGNPGIGVTGQTGKKGMTGNSVYFNTLDSFFTYIGDDTLTNSSIDYDDKEYDITYALDELRLNHIYNEGDILYIMSSESKDASVLYMVEITEDMTTCTKEYFLEHITAEKPFTTGHDFYNRPVNIVNSYNKNLLNANDKYKNGLIKITYEDDISPLLDVTDSDSPDFLDNYHEDIPKKYSETYNNIKYVNNGKEVHKYTYSSDTENKSLLSLNTVSPKYSFEIKSEMYKGIKLTTSNNNLCIDNLYVKNYNLGNVEAYNTIYYPTLSLDSNGNCYTLSESDYDASTLSLLIDISSFFNSQDVSIEDYTMGYTHMQWNYNDQNYNEKTKTNIYKPNYIYGEGVDTSLTKTRIIKTDSNGNFVRSFENIKDIYNMYVRELLIKTLDTSKLCDVSNLLNESVDEATYEKYSNRNGIINTSEIDTYVNYYYIQNHDRIQFKHYYDSFKTDELINLTNSKIISDPSTDYFDSSFLSHIDSVYDPSVFSISLVNKDDTDQIYRHHNILLWIEAPNGIKYFSKITEANYNYQTNLFDVSTSWVKPSNSVSYNETIEDNDNLFNININGTTLTVTTTDVDKVICMELYENGTKLTSVESDTLTATLTSTVEDITSYINNTDLLKNLYDKDDLNVEKGYSLITIKYNVAGETSGTYTHLFSYQYPISGYTEVRTLPVINLHMYNDMKSLEKLNSIDNGILCNQFQTFIDINITDFSYDDWGKLSNYVKNPKLKIKINKSFYTKKLDESDTDYTITWSLIKPNVDIFTASLKDLTDTDNIKTANADGTYTFTIDEAISGIYHLRLLIEHTNPEPLCINALAYIEELSVITDSLTYTLPLTNGCVTEELNVLKKNKQLYQSDLLKLALAPISYIAANEQSSDLITNISTTNWYGDNSTINIVVKPYRISDIEEKYLTYTNRTDKKTNWNAIKFKGRYFQDNIQTLNILPVNINNIYNLLPETYYNTNYIAEDQDDIYETYLQIVYNSELLNPTLIDDEYSIIYNNNQYLASEYGQYGNNTAVYINQSNDILIRNNNLLQSMKVWNKLYEETDYYDSDNPYLGVTETYGNGYQYLNTNIDTGLYLKDNIMSLSDVKTVNNEYIFDSQTYITSELNKPDKDDEYTPSVLFRALLYQIQWSYPKYSTLDNMNIIYQLPFANATISENSAGETIMPYNLCYDIYPRIMFNDEEQYNVALMLRRPCIMRENQYKMESTDSCFSISDINDLSDPINVLN